ncbi:hypothetical protein [Clostridium perfringens]|uniref:hypothetical protein n=1 Tax=Clostridium perfringens TaxID=1502 RepID=UPI003D330E6D
MCNLDDKNNKKLINLNKFKSKNNTPNIVNILLLLQSETITNFNEFNEILRENISDYIYIKDFKQEITDNNVILIFEKYCVTISLNSSYRITISYNEKYIKSFFIDMIQNLYRVQYENEKIRDNAPIDEKINILKKYTPGLQDLIKNNSILEIGYEEYLINYIYKSMDYHNANKIQSNLRTLHMHDETFILNIIPLLYYFYLFKYDLIFDSLHIHSNAPNFILNNINRLLKEIEN